MTDTPVTTLKPCPFCGTEAGDIKLSRGHGYVVACGMCQGQQFAMTHDEAVKLWNMRTPDLLAKVAELEQQLATAHALLEPLRRGRYRAWQVADELEAQVTELQARLEAWQPIETAPKDGSQVLGWTKAWGDRHVQNIWYYTMLDRWNTTMQPTHWMPLPAPPEEK